jgi:hypothetical protein
MDTDPDLAPDPDRQNLDADPDPAKSCRSDRIRIYNTDGTQYLKHVWDSASTQKVVHLTTIGNMAEIRRELYVHCQSRVKISAPLWVTAPNNWVKYKNHIQDRYDTVVGSAARLLNLFFRYYL